MPSIKLREGDAAIVFRTDSEPELYLPDDDPIDQYDVSSPPAMVVKLSIALQDSELMSYLTGQLLDNDAAACSH